MTVLWFVFVGVAALAGIAVAITSVLEIRALDRHAAALNRAADAVDFGEIARLIREDT